jgi:hypothetical protein
LWTRPETIRCIALQKSVDGQASDRTQLLYSDHRFGGNWTAAAVGNDGTVF